MMEMRIGKLITPRWLPTEIIKQCAGGTNDDKALRVMCMKKGVIFKAQALWAIHANLPDF